MTLNHCKFSFRVGELVNLLRENGLLTAAAPDIDAIEVEAVTTDSRQVSPDGAYIAYQGVQRDGHGFIGEVLSKKPRLVIFEKSSVLPLPQGAPWIQVSDARRAWSWTCALGFGMPHESLHFIGVTGTNGKTSCVWMLRQMLMATGYRVLSLGTLGTYFNEKKVETTHTTPDPPQLFSWLAEALTEKVTHVVMEVSSHALAHGRMDPLRFATAGFTSFSRDHLDFHGDMDAYWQAKWMLFDKYLEQDGRAIIAADLITLLPNNFLHNDLWFYGTKPSTALASPNFVEVIKEQSAEPSHYVVHEKARLSELSGSLAYLGNHAQENFALALTAFHQVTGSWFESAKWGQLPQIPGRLEAASDSDEPWVLVDYAHTPDALEKALAFCRGLSNGQVICVFGCGGERDSGKRALMGEIASRCSDTVIVTSDNPRGEDPATIIDDILVGKKSGATWHRIEDRQKAIAYAISNANNNDVVLIAGKGHETYQIIGKKKWPFDDRQVAKEALATRHEKHS